MKPTIYIALAIAALTLITAPTQAEISGQQAFDRLKSLEGNWSGKGGMLGAEDTWQPTVYELRVSAAGTVVMETMSPDTPHEMINMYYLDGDDVVLTHYCSGGNQPRMRLDLAKATATNLPFDFDGGTNLEDADHHIHSAHLVLHEDGRFESRWTSYAGEEMAGEMHVHLERSP